MTKKDYALLADTIRLAKPINCAQRNETPEQAANRYYTELKFWCHMREEIAYALGKDNSRFDRDRFTIACTTEQ